MERESTFLRHVPCSACGSSDAGALYTDGHIFCHRCQAHTKGDMSDEPTPRRRRDTRLIEIEVQALPKRKLTEDTCRHFHYGVGTYSNRKVQVAEYRNQAGDVVAQHIRTADKDFPWIGPMDDLQLFGQHLWRDTGKMVVITEGEIDAMSVSQVQDNKWPVVSVPNGASSAAKYIRKNLQWLEKFERVVFMLDMDEDGIQAAKDCAILLSPGKAYIARLPLKDANEMLKAGRGSEIRDAAWGATQFRPDGIVSGKDLFEKITNTDTFDAIPYPWSGLNAITRGCRRGELVTVVAGTGVGKSEVVRSIASYFHDKHDETIGYIALEESVQRTGLGLIGLHLGKRVHIDMGLATADELKAGFDKTVGSGRYFLYDHWGSLDLENLISRVRFMARGCNCGTIILDHISIVVSGLDTEDERKTIDLLMTRLRTLVEELQIRLVAICHLKRVEGRAAEEGGQISLSHIRGSQGVAQVSNMVIALERDQQDEEMKLFTAVRILKNRHTGETGIACWLKYDTTTGRLEEVDEPKQQSDPKQDFKSEDF